jgi:hypothetical protein
MDIVGVSSSEQRAKEILYGLGFTDTTMVGKRGCFLFPIVPSFLIDRSLARQPFRTDRPFARAC